VLHEDDPATEPTRSGGTVIVRLRDGRELTHRIDDMRGTRANPMSRHDVVAKFRANTRDMLGTSQADAAIEDLLRLDTLADVAPLFEGLCPSR
jgi:2-methylcitrate dehydratase PrpD